MSYYDYDKFVHPVPSGAIIPKDTQARRVHTGPHPDEAFFTTLGDLPIVASHELTYYLDYDITAQKLPNKVNSLIYNVHTAGAVYLVAVYRGGHTWSALSEQDDRNVIFNPEILSFDTTPPLDDRYAANEAKQREAADS